MRIIRLVTAFAGAGLVLAGPSALAATPSPTYPAQAPTLTVSANSVVDGSSVTVTGRGFLAGSSASETWTGAGALGVGGKAFGASAGGLRMGAKSLTANTSGDVTGSVRLLSLGDHTITLAGTAANGSVVSLSTVVTVTSATVGTSGNLPHTGAPILVYTAAGLVLLGLGALTVMLMRNRRRATPALSAPRPVRQPVA